LSYKSKFYIHNTCGLAARFFQARCKALTGTLIQETAMMDNNSKQTPQDFAMPAINFSTFILSLNSAALVHLGAATDPINGSRSVNLPLAKQTIDILAMMEEKTKGNLTDDEKRLVTHLMYELRLLYVKEAKGK